MNPGDRPKRGLLVVLAMVAVGAALVAIPAVVGTESASAEELQPFGSCEELSSWGRAAQTPTTIVGLADGGDAATAAEESAGGDVRPVRQCDR